jgi:hypothetical protein
VTSEKKDSSTNELDELIATCEKKEISNIKKCCPCEDGTR